MNLFEEVYERRKTRSIKWDLMEMIYEIEDASEILPLWVADMDFPAPPPVIDALKKRLEHPILGYTYIDDGCKRAIAHWQSKRNDWQVEEEEIMFQSGVIPAMAAILQVFTNPGDSVVVTPPVYPPFFSIPQNQGRKVLYSEMKETNGEYTLDYEDLEEKFKTATFFIFCHPHNPGGKVWKEDEMNEILRLAEKHDVLIISDEIHSDLVLKAHQHIPLAKLAGDQAHRIFTCIAPTKTFNLAGIQASMLIVTDPKKRLRLENHAAANGTGMMNAFAPVALQAAYEEGEAWLDELLEVLSSNMDYVIEKLGASIPSIKIAKPEATYLMWLDCRDLGLEESEIMKKLLHDGKVALEPGSKYGEPGTGFLRLNVACPRSMLEDGVERIIKALG
ncbi:MalY/PatB family protein [Planococcus salinarum]|uniref:MalY/PatB family protein n=1 Tax=Planococcus salinarum TaxID=622695 RepID=UPI000E3D95DB|nr:MalY/PatB family protein [Planococcus salinarum]TAA67871.1 pyridoxal phosphate-dependent aminotransferase [Planococcus salinarum]